MIGAPGTERRGWSCSGRATASTLLTLLLAGAAAAGPPAQKAAPGQGVARCKAVDGVLLERTPKQAWQAVKPGAMLPDGALVVAMPHAELVSRNGAVRVGLLSDVGKRGPLPVLESAVALHADPSVDLDLTLDRGLISLTNLKKEGAAKIRLRAAEQKWQLTLREPQASVLLELHGRHVPGAPEKAKGQFAPPDRELFMLVVKGSAFLDLGTKGFRLTAPPGTAVFHWDSLSPEPELRRLEKLPEALPLLEDRASDLYKKICARAPELAVKDVHGAIGKLLKSDSTFDRLLGATAAGATDDLPHLLAALADPKDAKVRDHAILVLRNWMGRGPGQVEKLREALKAAKFSDVHARTLVRLLFGFTTEERAAPATYELLIGYLKHSRLPVRELARWHLFRLAPAGRDIPYDAAAPAAERQRAFTAWRALVPEGKLPPAPKKGPAPK